MTIPAPHPVRLRLPAGVAGPGGGRPRERRPPQSVAPPAKVAVGQPTIGTSADGLTSILVPVRYPIELKGRVAELRVALIGARGKTIRSWVLHERLERRQAAPPRPAPKLHLRPPGRTRTRASAAGLRQGAMVRVVGSGEVDVDEDGKPEMSSPRRLSRQAGNGSAGEAGSAAACPTSGSSAGGGSRCRCRSATGRWTGPRRAGRATAMSWFAVGGSYTTRGRGSREPTRSSWRARA